MSKNRHDRRAETAKARKNPDPLKIFMNAERFRVADLVLRRVPDQNTAAAIGGPALVLSALASELYLKCFICLENSALAHGHDLHALFKLLSERTRRNIERRWNAYVATPQRQRIYAALRTISGKDVSTDLEWSLKNGASGFVDLRYIHELDNQGSKFVLGELPQLLREEILMLKPEWTNLIHGPMKTVPGFEDPAIVPNG